MTRGKHAVAAAKKREDRASILLAAARRENAELRRENARLEVIPVLEARIVRLEALHQAAVKRIREISPKPKRPGRVPGRVDCAYDGCTRAATEAWYTLSGSCEYHARALDREPVTGTLWRTTSESTTDADS